jgi:hypothetical protein
MPSSSSATISPTPAVKPGGCTDPIENALLALLKPFGLTAIFKGCQ